MTAPKIPSAFRPRLHPYACIRYGCHTLHQRYSTPCSLWHSPIQKEAPPYQRTHMFKQYSQTQPSVSPEDDRIHFPTASMCVGFRTPIPRLCIFQSSKTHSKRKQTYMARSQSNCRNSYTSSVATPTHSNAQRFIHFSAAIRQAFLCHCHNMELSQRGSA